MTKEVLRRKNTRVISDERMKEVMEAAVISAENGRIRALNSIKLMKDKKC